MIQTHTERQVELSSPASVVEDEYDRLVKGSSRPQDFDSFTAAPLPRNRRLRTADPYSPPVLPSPVAIPTPAPISPPAEQRPRASTYAGSTPANRTEINRAQQQLLQQQKQQQAAQQQPQVIFFYTNACHDSSQQ